MLKNQAACIINAHIAHFAANKLKLLIIIIIKQHIVDQWQEGHNRLAHLTRPNVTLGKTAGTNFLGTEQN